MHEPDLSAAELVMFSTMPEVLDAVRDGVVDAGFVAIENSIEGTVHLTQDGLIFDHDLLIQREVVLDIEMCLMGPSGMGLADVREILSIPVAAAQCRDWVHQHLPGVPQVTTNSTAEAAQLVGAGRPGAAAIGPALAGKINGLDVIAADIGDHDGNQTRFVVVAAGTIPAPTGHDKTSVVVYQRANVPGSLISILQEFAARRINLTKLESRPTKKGGLGDYCFVIDVEGHVTDDVLADCLRDLYAKQGGVKFLGSYPAAGAHADAAREQADEAWRLADRWIAGLRGRAGQ